MKNAFRKKFSRITMTQENQWKHLLGNILGHHIGHYVNAQCEIPFQSAEEKLPAVLAEFFLLPTYKIIMRAFEVPCMLNKGWYHRLSFIVSD